jgi:putative transposase
MHSFVSCLMHVVFSTRNRQPLINAELHRRFGPYVQGIATKNNMHVLTTGGVEDHVHILLSLPSTMAISKAVQLI